MTESQSFNSVQEPIPAESGSKWKIIRHIFYFLLSGIVIYYFIISTISPVLYTREINSLYGPDSTMMAPPANRFLADSLYVGLSHDLAFLQASNRMAASDSIGLTVNLYDSTIILGINGVTMRSMPVISYEIPGSLRGVDHYALSKFLSEPIPVESSEATIVKEPLMVKIAPRDTAEASALPIIAPDTSGVAPVFFRLRLGNGVNLVFLQEKGEDRKSLTARRQFLFRRSLRVAATGLKHAATLKIPPYEPEIRIEVSKVDARIIYRAIPNRGEVVLSFR